jgi:hypothetical protein
MTAMKTTTRMLRSLNLGSDPNRRRVGEYQAGAARLGGAEAAGNALKKVYCALAVVLALSSSLVHALSPTCAAPGCNSVTSDINDNTASGTSALVNNTNGYGNTASGYAALFNNTGGYENTASGLDALVNNTTGFHNTSSGVDALYDNTTGYDNTASGVQALFSNTTGFYNTASGVDALFSNTTGGANTAAGTSALQSNTTGSNNTASGSNALQSNTTGSNNTASGFEALEYNTTGEANTAMGNEALYSNSTGFNNNAAGAAALHSNTIGNYNEASGQVALYSNTSGSGNEASGHAALYFNTTGSYNVAIGYAAGYSQTTGSNNIYISHRGVAGESGVTRIGTPNTQTETYIAGIENAKITGNAVYVTSSGQLGVLASSERYKTAIAPIGTTTEKLQQLRPVSFHLKSDPEGAVQYGLIAEEVAKVYPELVIRDAAGIIQGVRYDELAPMLLNEMQRQAAEIRGLKTQLAELNDLKQELHAAIR